MTVPHTLSDARGLVGLALGVSVRVRNIICCLTLDKFCVCAPPKYAPDRLIQSPLFCGQSAGCLALSPCTSDTTQNPSSRLNLHLLIFLWIFLQDYVLNVFTSLVVTWIKPKGLMDLCHGVLQADRKSAERLGFGDDYGEKRVE